jgi:hypothetical protein
MSHFRAPGPVAGAVRPSVIPSNAQQCSITNRQVSGPAKLWPAPLPSLVSTHKVSGACPAQEEVPTDLTEAAYLRARRGQGRPGADRESMFAVIALREIRESIRDAGLRRRSCRASWPGSTA